MNEITVKAPATSANLGAGFDICGLALENPFDLIRIKAAKEMSINNIGRFAALDDTKESIFATVINKLREDFGFEENFEITIQKSIRPRGGLGGSGAEAVGTVFGVSEILGLDLRKNQIVQYAAFGEKFIAGSPHLDNVTPCTYGGFTISYSNSPIRIKRVSPPENLECLLISPDKEKPSTKFAREVLPQTVPRDNALYNNLCFAKLLCGFMDGDIELIAEALDDKIVEPARAKVGILLNLLELREIGRKYGYGFAASGAGPTLIALGNKKNGNKIEFEQAIKNLFAKTNVKIELLWTKPSEGGVSSV